jgi:hypothetical protein
MRPDPVELIYTLFLLAAVLATVLLGVVTTIQYYKLEERRHENTNTDDTTIHHDRYEYQGNSQSMGYRSDDAEGNYILPYIPGDQHPRLYECRASNNRATWAPAYYYPWHKHPRLDAGEPYIQGPRSLLV